MTDFGLHKVGARYVYGNKTLATLDDVGVSNTELVIVNNSSATVTQDIEQGKFYKFTSAVSTLTVNCIDVQSDGILPVYCGKFSTSNSGCLFTVAHNNETPNGGLSLSPNSIYEFYVVDGELSLTLIDSTDSSITAGVNVAALSIGEGTLDAAYNRALLNLGVKFQWLLVDSFDGNTVRKMIWHMGNGVFVDAFGGTMIATTNNG